MKSKSQLTKYMVTYAIVGSGTLLIVTAKLVGRTAEANLLALCVLDLAYLPRLNWIVSVSTLLMTPA